MGFNLEGMGLGAAAMLHLLLLAIFITVFFWMPKFGPAEGYVNNMEYFASNTGHTLYAALQQACNRAGGQPGSTVPTQSLRDKLEAYLERIEDADNASKKKNNRDLLIVSCSSLAALFVIMIVVIIVAKVRRHKVDWGRMVAYCFGVFVLFCAFELALYFVVIKHYLPIGQMEMGEYFINELRSDLLRMEKSGYTPPRDLPASLPDTMRPVLMYTLKNLPGLAGPVAQLNEFRTTPVGPGADSAAAT